MSPLNRLIKNSHAFSKVLPFSVPGNVALPSRLVVLQRGLSESKKDLDADNKPVVFSKSRAARNPLFVITQPNVDEKDNMPWYHPHAAVLSFAMFMIYFCILREENDIDEKLSGESNVETAKKIMDMQKAAMARENLRDR